MIITPLKRPRYRQPAKIESTVAVVESMGQFTDVDKKPRIARIFAKVHVKVVSQPLTVALFAREGNVHRS